MFIIILLVFILLIIILFMLNRFYLRSIYSIKSKNTKQRISKIIIQTWKYDFIPKRFHKLVDEVKKLNPDYDYLFYSDDDIDEFLSSKYPHYYETYLKLPINIQKFDFFRYIVLYHYGGIYLDMDMFVMKNFDEILQEKCVIPIEQYVNIKNKRYNNISKKNEFLLGNYGMACERNNDFMKKLVDGIHTNIDDIIKRYERINNKLNKEIFVYETTGPDYVTYSYLDYPNKNEIQLLVNPYTFNSDIHTFGGYARHLTFGSWKNDDQLK